MTLKPVNRRHFLQTAAAGSLLAPLGLAASPDTAPVSAPGTPGPDLGNLFDTVQQMAKQRSAQLSFLDPKWKSLEEWKAIARPEFIRLLHYAPPPEPLRATTLGIEERDGFTVETLRINATAAYDLPAWLLLPAKRTGRIPGIVAHHCHGGCFTWGHEKIISHRDETDHARQYRENAYGRPYAEFLARRGYAVLVIDAFYFGQRRYSGGCGALRAREGGRAS